MTLQSYRYVSLTDRSFGLGGDRIDLRQRRFRFGLLRLETVNCGGRCFPRRQLIDERKIDCELGIGL
jgi:hypothetical protein